MAPRSIVHLEDDQKFKLMKFKRSVSDVVKPHHDDHFLLRWLRARNWNVEAAEKMLRDSMKWRERMAADDVHNWDGPKLLNKYCPHGLAGFDKGGSPIIIVPFAGMDMYGVLHAVSRSDMIRYTLQQLEKYMDIAMEQSKVHGPEARQFIVIFDMEDFYLKQFAWRPASEVVITLIKLYADNYPEILKTCYIINAPKVFAFAFNVVKKFLDEYTLSKIQIYKADRSKWLPAILEKVDAKDLPKHFGGEMTDSDGNPKCESKICYGGRVPKDLYVKQDDGFGNNNTYTEDTIKKGGKIKLEYTCDEPGCFLKWEFRTFEHDIRFGIRCKNNKTEEVIDEIPLKRVASHQLNEVGFIPCLPNCSYTVCFDNSYSYFKNKKIHYAVSLTPPLNDTEKIVEEATSDINFTTDLETIAALADEKD